VSVLGFGAFKIGRAVGVKYPTPYDLPDEDEAARVLGGVLDLGITLIDTAPAYGLSEERIGRHLAHRRSEFVLSTKVGERFEDGVSRYDFSPAAMRHSVETSLRRLRTDAVDLLLVHSDGNDEVALAAERVPDVMLALREEGLTRRIGFSGKTPEAAEAALAWAEVLMVTYHAEDTTHTDVMRRAREAGVGVLVKKALASGHHPPATAIPLAVRHPAVDSVVVGGLNLDHLRTNAELAAAAAAAP
jgi:aryl-alcohol dehydrogenase-like predicted oxidoreductase